jgi:hypothetical protein
MLHSFAGEPDADDHRQLSPGIAKGSNSIRHNLPRIFWIVHKDEKSRNHLENGSGSRKRPAIYTGQMKGRSQRFLAAEFNFGSNRMALSRSLRAFSM